MSCLKHVLESYDTCKTFMCSTTVMQHLKKHENILSLQQSTWRGIAGSSHQRCSMEKGGLRNFTEFTGNHLCQSLFFNKNAGVRPTTLLKRRLWHRCFPVNFVKFLRTPFLQNISGRLLLDSKVTGLRLVLLKLM